MGRKRFGALAAACVGAAALSTPAIALAQTAPAQAQPTPVADQATAAPDPATPAASADNQTTPPGMVRYDHPVMQNGRLILWHGAWRDQVKAKAPVQSAIPAKPQVKPQTVAAPAPAAAAAAAAPP